MHGGLVGQWELGEVIQPPCAGINHGGEDWTLKDGQQISGNGNVLYQSEKKTYMFVFIFVFP